MVEGFTIQRIWARFLLTFVILFVLVVPTHSAETDEYAVFINGFTAFMNQDYRTSVDSMNSFLRKHPDTQLRDVALFWLARAQFRLGNREEAAKNMALFFRDYPDNPLRSAVEEELAKLAQAYATEGKPPRPDSGPVVTAKNDQVVHENAPAPSVETARVISLTSSSKSHHPEEEKLPAKAETTSQTSAASKRAASISPGREEQGVVEIVPQKILVAKKDQKRSGRRIKAKNPSLEQKALAEHRSRNEKYPGSRAAARAGQSLKKSGKQQTAPEMTAAAPDRTRRAEMSPQFVDLQVSQFAEVDFSVSRYNDTIAVGSTVQVPFQVRNRGNAPDAFLLQTAFPPEFKAAFSSAGSPGAAITATPQLAAGESFHGLMTLTIPASMVDGQKATHPVKIISQFDPGISISRNIPVSARAPLLRLVTRPDRELVAPGEKVSYRIALLNIGSAPAKKVSITLSYPSQYEPTGALSSGSKLDSKSVIVSENIEIASGESKEFNVEFRLRADALAEQELFCRVVVENLALRTRETFVSPTAKVQRVSSVAARANTTGMRVLPGQKVVIPFTVTNTGNDRDSFALKPAIPTAVRYAFSRNAGEGARQHEQPVAGRLGPLSPGEEASLKLELHAPEDAADNTDSIITVAITPERNPEQSSLLSFRLLFSRPIVQMDIRGGTGRLKPGEISHLRMSVVNNGSSMAKEVEVRSVVPDNIEIVGAEPGLSMERDNGKLWLFPELGPGEKRNIVLAYRVKPGIAAGTNLRIETMVRYRDQKGNQY
jgi:uncharacterized membrane protein